MIGKVFWNGGEEKRLDAEAVLSYREVHVPVRSPVRTPGITHHPDVVSVFLAVSYYIYCMVYILLTVFVDHGLSVVVSELG